jgi:hypothetical protein
MIDSWYKIRFHISRHIRKNRNGQPQQSLVLSGRTVIIDAASLPLRDTLYLLYVSA